jgi:class 3 adenylate cyclase/tetratricopeptide (TPR) repeat protein
VRQERKVVTVLFADLVGFTSRAESLDPEDVQAILRPYHERLRAELERHGGTVEKFIGDAVMALFGAPSAHDDDPERAVRAALAIRDWAREEGELEVRVGVTTGEALVSLTARPEAGEGMASGDVVNTAARLQTAAPENGVLVDETTFRATERAIEYQEREPVEAKGKSKALPVWEPVQARARVGVDVRGPRTPLVGRAREVDLLAGALARARDESSPQLVTIVGEPGIGKSRLVYELFQRLEAEPGLVYWRQGRSLPYGEGVSFWSLGEMVKKQAGILETDSSESADEKLRAAVAELPDPEWLARHLRTLLGLGEAELGEDRDEAFTAWRRFFEGLAEQRPLVLVFEDLHWADEGLLDFVDHLVDWAGRVPILVVASARPELLERRPGWGGGKRNATTLSLAPLTDKDTAQMVATLLETPVLSADTQAQLLGRAGGNPLYAEEFARMLSDRGGIEHVPETLQGLIAARLDGLSAEEKALLQRAAVVGRVFWLGAVEAMDGASTRELEDRLHGLERKEFVRRERRSSVEDDAEFVFLHELVRDVAYGQIPRADRADQHRRAAEWLGSLGRSEDHAEMLAHHYLRALELSEAAGLDTPDLIQPARRALSDAGDRAAALYVLDAAERFYDAALRLTPDDGPERADLLFRRAVPVGPHIAGGDPDRLEEALTALLAVGDDARAALVETLLSQRYWIEGLQDRAEEHAERALALLGDAAPSRETAWVLARQAARLSVAFEFAEGREAGRRALEVAERVGWDEGVSDTLSTIGMSRLALGDPGGLGDIERSIAGAEQAGSPGTLSRALNGLAVAHQILGDFPSALQARQQAAEVGMVIRSVTQDAWYWGALSDHHFRLGQWEEAAELAGRVIELVESGTPSYAVFQPYIVRAELRLARGDDRGALSDAERAEDAARTVGGPQALSFVRSATPHVFSLTMGDEAGSRVRAFLSEFGERPLGFCMINLPRLAFAALRVGLENKLLGVVEAQPEGQWSNAVRAIVSGDLGDAAERLKQIGSKTDEAEARLHSGKREQVELALEFYRSVGATRFIREAEGLLAASA